MKRRTDRIVPSSCWEQLRTGKVWQRLSLALLVAVMTMTAQTARAASGDTYVVDANGGGDYTTIYEAVSHATGGETIFIKNGEYTETVISIGSKQLTFIGESQDGVIIKSGNNNLFYTAESGYSSIVISNLTFKDISMTGGYTPISISGDGDVTIENCTFNNCASRYGAMRIYTSGSVTIDNCTFLNTKSSTGSYSSAIDFGGSSDSDYTITNTVIDGSSISDASTASYIFGAIYNEKTGGTVTLDNVTIRNCNLGKASGLIATKGNMVIKNSQLVNNYVYRDLPVAGFIFVSGTATVTIESSLIQGNTNPNYFLSNNSASASFDLNYNNIQGNTFKTAFTNPDNGTYTLNANYWGSDELPAGITASTWVVDAGGEYTLNTGDPLEKEIPVIPYIDAEGNTANCTVFTAIDGSETTLGAEGKATWYVVKNSNTDENVNNGVDAKYTGTLTLNGDVNLILCDGAKMDVTCSADGIVNNGSLTIYGQSTGDGKLTVSSTNGSGISGGTVNLAGGTINASRYSNCSVIIANGLAYTDGTNTYSGTLTTTQISDIAGQTLSKEASVVIPEVTIYVSETGSDENDGSTQDAPTTLQNALEIAPEGGSIFLCNGEYDIEQLIISKSVKLVGESRDGVILTGDGGGFIIEDLGDSDDFVSFSKMTIESSFSDFIYVPASVTDLTITDCVLSLTGLTDRFLRVGVDVEATGTLNFKKNIIISDDVVIGVAGQWDANINDNIFLNSNSGEYAVITEEGEGIVNVDYNYWGSNDPATTLDYNNFIIATASSDATEIYTDESAEITVAMTLGDGTNANGHLPDYPIEATLSADGSLSQNSLALENGVGNVVSYSSDVARNDNIQIEILGQTLTVPITVKERYLGTIYVATTGSDDNEGSVNAPVATVGKAIELALVDGGSGEIIINEGTYVGNGYHVTGDLTVTGNGKVTLDANNEGRLFYMDYGDTANKIELKNLILTNAKGYGAAVNSFANELILKNDTIVKNYANGYLIRSYGKLTIKDSEISESKSGNVIQQDASGDIFIKNTVFANDTIHDTTSVMAVVYINSGSGNMVIEDSKFIENSARQGVIKGNFNYNIKVKGTEFRDNTNELAYGGTIYISGGNLDITNCVFNGNKAYRSGGAIYVGYRVTAKVDSCIFINNVADTKDDDYYGDAIYNGNKLTVTNSAFLGGYDNFMIYNDGETNVVTAQNCWWGTNEDPSSMNGFGYYEDDDWVEFDCPEVDVSNWATMSAAFTPADAQAGDEVTVTATFSNTDLPDGIPVKFASTSGKLDIVVSTEDAQASTTYTIDANDEAITATSGNATIEMPIHVITLADNATGNATTIAENDGAYANVTLSGRTLFRDGDWNTLCLPFPLTAEQIAASPLAGADIRTLDDASFSNGTLTLNFTEAGDVTAIAAGTPYIVRWNNADLVINNATDWNNFATAVNNGNTYVGKTVKLGADISGVTTMVGTWNGSIADHVFSGTFDGNGHTLTVSIDESSTMLAAPFMAISGATIKNLKVAGTVSGGIHCAGLVGVAENATTNSITNCEVAVNVITTGTHCGGVLGHGRTSATTISDCLFSGSISGASTATGIFYGWDDNGTHTIKNCLFTGSATGGDIDLLKRNGSQGAVNVNNCYKTVNVGTQGTLTTATGSNLAGQLGDGWTVSGTNVVPKKLTAANIESPVFTDVTISKATAPVETQYVDFMGTYEPMSFTDADPSILFLGANNTLYYPENGANIGCQRAYFQLKGISAGGPKAAVRAFVLNFGDDAVETGIIAQPTLSSQLSTVNWYTLDGRRLSAKPTQRGVYINNGKKVVIK